LKSQKISPEKLLLNYPFSILNYASGNLPVLAFVLEETNLNNHQQNPA